jgi:DNA primase
MQDLLKWLGANDDQVNRIAFECLKIESKQVDKIIALPDFKPRPMPENSKKITEDLLIEEEQVLPVVQYMYDRGLTLEDNDFYWSERYKDRLIIPLTVEHNIVGYIARKTTQGNPKYLTEHPPHVVFNLDKQGWDRKFVLVFEGSIDAILLGGVAVLTNEISPEQALQINALGRQVIVVPDKDKAGTSMINQAINLGWSVAFPNWDKDIKDAGDAVLRYGRLATMMSIMQNVETNELKIKLRTNINV